MREVLKIFHSYHPLARLSGDGGGISNMVENVGKCNKKERGPFTYITSADNC